MQSERALDRGARREPIGHIAGDGDDGSVAGRRKVEALERHIQDLGTVAVAFSGGADSTLLLAMCLRVLGREAVLAITADSPTLPRAELQETRLLAEELGAEHVLIETAEMEDERFTSNPPDRCFYCKQELFESIRALATERGYTHIAYGATAGDLGDHRPGMRAAAEAGAVAPLLEAGFTKQDVRELSREIGLRTWDKPAMACLSSRFPYGTTLAEPALARVERAEDLLRRELGFRQVRVRHHGAVARIELDPNDIERAMTEPVRTQIVDGLQASGYSYVTLDLAGFRSGSMNEVLDTEANLAR
jgi:uncharacterized protein